MSKQRDQLMGHAADNDGIEEYDNPLPDWWVGLFIFTILFGIGYMVEYHVISGRSQGGAYLAQLEEAKERWPDFGKVAGVPTDPESIAEGKAIYDANCVACHGANLEGGIGPNLVDSEWIHGGSPEEIVAVINEGVAAKGMPAWGPILGPDRVAKAAAYIVSMAGSAPSAPAAPAEPAAVEPVQVVEIAELDPATITDEMLASGAEVYAAQCAACHKPDMTGLVGPSLVDDEWTHGGTFTDIVRTVTNGVPGTAMISWTSMLGEEKVRDVSAYIYTKSRSED